ncbi:MAG TPA: hypothetical protein RMH99_04205 [Sandaracinaceae bacterium LLY-WYZ-13_1]|nr:hypothetical protein [Sandaracinaceae bacterium LLY-WYZ-13_1]
MGAGSVRGRLRARWLVSARYDLTFFVGSCVVTWLFLGLYHGLGSLGFEPKGESILVVYFLYTALFDHPHIFQTFSRTHGDPAERRRNRALHTFGLVAFVAVGLYLNAIGWWREVIVFAAIYGSWHIVRQHWGLLNVYKKLNDDRARVDHWIDSAVFYLGMLAFLLHDYAGAAVDTPIWGALTVRFPAIPEWVGEATFYAFLASAAVFVGRQLWRVARGEPLNVPKLLLLVAALGTHGLVFFFTATPFLIAEALETAYHNVQYQGWTMTYQRRRFRSAKLVRRWLVAGLIYGLAVGSIELLGLTVGGAWSWVFVPFAMIVVYHYYVDGRIWRTREAPELKRAMLAEEPRLAAEPRSI